VTEEDLSIFDDAEARVEAEPVEPGLRRIGRADDVKLR